MSEITIVLATDGSVEALKAASWVNSHFASRTVTVHVVSVVGVSSFDAEPSQHGVVHDTSWSTAQAVQSAWSRARLRAQEALEQTARVLTGIQRIEPCMLQSPRPAEAIVHYAREHHADMIVVGRRGHSRLGTLIGSVSFAIVHQSPIPITVVGAHPLWDTAAPTPSGD